MHWGFSSRPTFKGNMADISAPSEDKQIAEANALEAAEERDGMITEAGLEKLPDKFGPSTRRLPIRNESGFLRTPHWLTPPPHHNNARWLMRYMLEDVTQSSIYLNSLIRPSRHCCLLKSLPRPFYAPCLRVSGSVVTQLIR